MPVVLSMDIMLVKIVVTLQLAFFQGTSSLHRLQWLLANWSSTKAYITSKYTLGFWRNTQWVLQYSGQWKWALTVMLLLWLAGITGRPLCQLLMSGLEVGNRNSIQVRCKWCTPYLVIKVYERAESNFRINNYTYLKQYEQSKRWIHPTSNV